MHPESPDYKGPKRVVKDKLLIFSTPIVGIKSGELLDKLSFEVIDEFVVFTMPAEELEQWMEIIKNLQPGDRLHISVKKKEEDENDG